MDLEIGLALYRTHLAEKRTALSELQFALLLVTLPLTLHAALMLLADRHEEAARALRWPPVLAAVGALALAGLILLGHGLRGLWRAERRLRATRPLEDLG